MTIDSNDYQRGRADEAAKWRAVIDYSITAETVAQFGTRPGAKSLREFIYEIYATQSEPSESKEMTAWERFKAWERDEYRAKMKRHLLTVWGLALTLGITIDWTLWSLPSPGSVILFGAWTGVILWAAMVATFRGGPEYPRSLRGDD